MSETIREIVAETEGKGLSTYLNAKLANSQFLHQNHITAADLFALAFSINYIVIIFSISPKIIIVYHNIFVDRTQR